MHQFLATLFSLLVALCHHTSLTARPVEAAEVPVITYATHPADASDPTMILPDRYQLARSSMAEGGYAEAACLSCRRTEALTSAR